MIGFEDDVMEAVLQGVASEVGVSEGVVRERSYEEMRAQGISMRLSGDRNDWDLGDLACEVQAKADHILDRVRQARESRGEVSEEDQMLSGEARKLLKRFAGDIGVSQDHLVRRKTVAEKFSRHDPVLGWVRGSTLPFSSCRYLSSVEDAGECNRLCIAAVEEGLSVAQIKERVGTLRDQSAVQQGLYTCAQCHEPVTEQESLYSVRHAAQSTLLCGPACLMAYAMGQGGAAAARAGFDAEMNPVLPPALAAVSGDVYDL